MTDLISCFKNYRQGHYHGYRNKTFDIEHDDEQIEYVSSYHAGISDGSLGIEDDLGDHGDINKNIFIKQHIKEKIMQYIIGFRTGFLSVKYPEKYGILEDEDIDYPETFILGLNHGVSDAGRYFL
jgi:hypothetical protein